MSRFTRALLVSPKADGKSWILRAPFSYAVGSEDSGDVIEVEEGFVTDFTSVPRIFWAVIPRWGTYGNAAVVHDWLYWTQERPRAEADAVMLEAMNVLGVGLITRLTIFWGARLFGGIAWWRNRRDRDAGYDRVERKVKMMATDESERPGLMQRVVEQVGH